MSKLSLFLSRITYYKYEYTNIKLTYFSVIISDYDNLRLRWSVVQNYCLQQEHGSPSRPEHPKTTTSKN